MSGLRRVTLSLALFMALIHRPVPVAAAFTETLPRGLFMLDVAYNHSFLSGAWDNDGDMGPLIDPIERYEPGGGKQGRLVPHADVQISVVVMQLQYGILDALSLAVGVPIVVNTTITPSFEWEPGVFQPQLGRPYSESDFWEWAESMGQPKPGRFEGNRGVLSDIVLGGRLRFSDWIPGFARADMAMALSVLGAIPTGQPADADEPVSAGTTLWDLQTQGDLGFHLSVDKMFTRELDGRLVLGLDVFYEVFFPRTMRTPTGRKHPLLMNVAPYAGATYQLNPGDYYGFSVAADVVIIRGPAFATWISGRDEARARSFPPLLTLSVLYTFTGIGQSQYSSRSDLWDHDQERQWRAGYRNALRATALFSFMRLGVPLQLYVSYRSLQLIPGRNARAADVVTAGLRLPFTF